MKKCFIRTAALFIAIIGFTCNPALAVVIDFEDLPHADELQGAGNSYTSKGFTLTYAPAVNEPYPVGFTTVGPSWQYNRRSAAFTANSCSATTILTSDNSKPFMLDSIDLAALNGDKGIVVEFVGTTVEGTTVIETFHLVERNVWKKYQLPREFRNLISVTWTQGDCIVMPPHMFDNIHVTPSVKNNNDN